MRPEIFELMLEFSPWYCRRADTECICVSVNRAMRGRGYSRGISIRFGGVFRANKVELYFSS